jgi:hypothetical protein
MTWVFDTCCDTPSTTAMITIIDIVQNNVNMIHETFPIVLVLPVLFLVTKNEMGHVMFKKNPNMNRIRAFLCSVVLVISCGISTCVPIV